MTIPVFYTSRMVADSASFSPSARKPQYVVDRWKAKGLPIELCEFDPLTVEQLTIAHARSYVEGVLAGKSKNGFGNTSPEVAATLPYTNGAMYSAAVVALNRGIACAPVSGFHHAKYATPEGFCTFNGLVVTAMLLKRNSLAQRVGILDFDAHYGDGTVALIKRHNLDYIEHYTFGEHVLGPRSLDKAQATLRDIVPVLELMKSGGCDVVLYQAGADPHINDPYGGYLTDEQLRVRDETTFTTAKRLGLPIAWNLAGGYQQLQEGVHSAESIAPVLDIHEATMRECIKVYHGEV